jgi:hypothetical protein
MNYAADRAFSDVFLPTIRQIVGPLLLVPTSVEVDRNEATDLIVLKARDMRIACRIRKRGYAVSFSRQITIRAKRDSGRETEFAKMRSGFADWMFYGHAGATAPDIDAWVIVDLDEFRRGLDRVAMSRLEWLDCAGEISNGDGSQFYWFDLRKFAAVCDSDRLVVATNIECLKRLTESRPRASLFVPSCCSEGLHQLPVVAVRKPVRRGCRIVSLGIALLQRIVRAMYQYIRR